MRLIEWLIGKKKSRATPEGCLPLCKGASTDWQHNEICFMLLQQFLAPARVSKLDPVQWETVLGESLQTVLIRLIDDGILVRSSLAATVEFCNTVPALKRLLKERGLKVSGNKKELAERLVVVDEVGMSKLLVGEMLLECAPKVGAG